MWNVVQRYRLYRSHLAPNKIAHILQLFVL